jgi:hypothetical protein
MSPKMKTQFYQEDVHNFYHMLQELTNAQSSLKKDLVVWAHLNLFFS